MSTVAEFEKQLIVGPSGLTIGGEPVPGCISDQITVQEDPTTPGLWKVSVTFLTTTYPISAPGLVDEPINTRVIRPATPGDD